MCIIRRHDGGPQQERKTRCRAKNQAGETETAAAQRVSLKSSNERQRPPSPHPRTTIYHIRNRHHRGSIAIDFVVV